MSFGHGAADRAEPAPKEDAAYRAEVAAMGPKRRAEFLAGRRCAAAAVAACAPELAGTVIAVGADRAPLWPTGVVGAITHTADFASAAVARTRDAGGVGLDVEERIEIDEAREVRGYVASAVEIDLARSALGLDEAAAVTLLFSAKESVFKALYPRVRRSFEYRDAEVVYADAAERRVSARLAIDLPHGISAGFLVEVRFAIDARRVHTGALLAPW